MENNPLRALRRVVAGPDYPPVRLFGGRWPRLAGVVRPVLVLIMVLVWWASVVDLRDDLSPLGAFVIATLALAPLPVLVRWPLNAWRLCLVALFVGALNTAAEPWPWGPAQVVVTLIVLWVMAIRADRAELAWIAGLTLVPVWLFTRSGDDSAAVTFFVVAVAVIGDQVQRRRGAQRALAAQTEVSELEQARRTVLEERTRIARELHDVVAHHMSLIAVRAETAPYRLGGLPEPAREEFAAVAQAARESLTEMRRLLGVLRNDSGVPELSPQPDLAAVAELVAAAREAGATVHYLPPEPEALEKPPAAVGLAGFRIVQEALANATRHAPGAAVTVQAWPGSRDLAVRVHNDAAPGAQPLDVELVEAGHGLTGMRERAIALGGEFSAGPSSNGGFVVTATLPYDGAGGEEGQDR